MFKLLLRKVKIACTYDVEAAIIFLAMSSFSFQTAINAHQIKRKLKIITFENIIG